MMQHNPRSIFVSLTIALLGMHAAIDALFAQQMPVPYFQDEAIVVDALINDKPARFLFDTGASHTAFLQSGTQRLALPVEPSGKILVAGTEIETGRTQSLNVAIFGRKIEQRFQVLPFQNAFDAVLGWRDIPVPILIDGRNRLVKQQYELPPKGNWLSWKMEMDHPQLFFNVKQGEQDIGRVFVDTGVAGGLRLSPTLWNRWKGENQGHPITLETFQYSVGMPLVSEIAWVGEYRLGDLKFQNLDIGLIPSAKEDQVVDITGREYVATIGMRALRHLRLIISRGTGEVWTQSVSDIPNHNRLGAVFAPRSNEQDGLYCHLLAGTPAEFAGLHEGDRLLKVNDIDFHENVRSHLAQLAHLFSQPAGTTLTLTISRGEKEIEIVATLKDLF